MNRWFGGKDESDKQAAERNSRAARRTLAEQQQQLRNIVSSDEEEVFGDCNTSLLAGNVDGTDDTEVMADEQARQAELARQRGLPVEDSDFENDWREHYSFHRRENEEQQQSDQVADEYARHPDSGYESQHF